MKTLIITKNILKRFIKLALIILASYAIFICFIRAAYMSTVTAEDIAVFALCVFGIITLCIVEYILNFLCLTLSRMHSACSYSYQLQKTYSPVKKSIKPKSKREYTLKNGEAA